MATPDWLGSGTGSNLAQLLSGRFAPAGLLFECDDGRTFTYGSFWSLSGQLLGALKKNGARRGDRIAIQVDKSVEALALFWACARGGLIFLPLNTGYTPAELEYFIADAEPSVVICDPAKAAALGAAHGRILTLDAAGQGSLIDQAIDDEAADIATGWDDPAAILYTSGTTGRSKGAVLTHGNLASNALALVDAWRFTRADKLIHALPVYHTHGLFTATNTVMLSGGSIFFRRKFDADDVFSVMPRATAMMGVPTFYTRLLQSERLTAAATAHMRLFVSGSAPLLAETHRAFHVRTGHAILERYGMTETSMITSNPLEGERKPGAVGFPLPHISVRITRLEGASALPLGETGMIEVKGPNLFKEYWRNPEKTAEDKTADGYFRTGDVGRFDEQGYLFITGRAKDLIITGGLNVYPKEIEEVLDGLAGVVESAVVGLPHDDFGEAVTALIVLEKGLEVSEASVLEAAAPRLARFKLPKRVLFVDQLPRNAMGKVQKALIRQAHAGLYRPV